VNCRLGAGWGDGVERPPPRTPGPGPGLVVPFAPADRTARDLERIGRTIRFEALDGPGHYDMAAYVPSLRRAAEWIRDRWTEADRARRN
jgi:hypothetical protein